VDGIDALRLAEFGFPGELRDRLVRAILDGAKTATASLLEEYGPGLDPMPAAGDRTAVVDSSGRRVAVIETTDVRVAPFVEVDLPFARDEGEGFESVDDWRRAHVRFWESDRMRAALGRPGFRIRDDTPVVLERFRLVAAGDPTS
jgi:uncharacterized protein YhfF